jgi:4'-phosphopantetheinyl transferase
LPFSFHAESIVTFSWPARSIASTQRLSPPENGRIDVWAMSLDASPDLYRTFRGHLTAEERERAERYRRERDGRSFVCARGWFRTLLGAYLGMEPGAVPFATGEHGKPYIPDGPDWSFNLSHSGGVALAAVAGADRVGIDVEAHRPVDDLYELADRFFSDREARRLRELPEADARRGFFHAWTRKEAFVKAVGTGLSLPLHTFDVSLAPSDPARLIDCRADAWASLPWSLHDLAPADGYSAALAVPLSNPSLCLRHWTPGPPD